MGSLGANGPNFIAETLLRMAKKAGITCIDATILDCTQISGKWLLSDKCGRSPLPQPDEPVGAMPLS